MLLPMRGKKFFFSFTIFLRILNEKSSWHSVVCILRDCVPIKVFYAIFILHASSTHHIVTSTYLHFLIENWIRVGVCGFCGNSQTDLNKFLARLSFHHVNGWKLWIHRYFAIYQKSGIRLKKSVSNSFILFNTALCEFLHLLHFGNSCALVYDDDRISDFGMNGKRL